MPSASAKLEKQASTEASDFIKQVLTMVEKKVRNLEKRKGKLDNYKAESANGKELNEDQLKAVSKYEQVVEMLEFSKDLQKSVQTINTDCVKQHKKNAKREQAERQQQEIQRVREMLLLQDLLNNMGSDEIREDFLKGSNGAVKLNESELDQLDSLFKLVCPNRDTEDASAPTATFNEQLSSSAEHLVLLLDSKNKDVVGTNYKTLKELLMKINASGYFEPEEIKESEEIKTEIEEEVEPIVDANLEGQHYTEEYIAKPATADVTTAVQSQQPNAGYCVANNSSSTVSIPASNIPHFPTPTLPPPPPPPQTGPSQPPLQDVLLQPRGSFNFLQESQVDLESPHMDPAVVVAHPMAPPPLGFHPGQSGESLLASTQPISPPILVSGPQVVTSGQHQPDYDPGRPIPTQTFTNQNFAALQSIIPTVPPTGGFVAAPVLSALTPSIINQGSISATTEPPPGLGFTRKTPEPYNKALDYSSSLGNNVPSQPDRSQPTGHYQSSDDNEVNDVSQNSGHNNNYRGRGGRGGPRPNRGGPNGPTNGYSRGGNRGTGNYSNGRGNYQGSGGGYYGNRDRESYGNGSGNPRRGTSGTGGAPSRGGPPRGGRGGPRGTGNYRAQE